MNNYQLFKREMKHYEAVNHIEERSPINREFRDFRQRCLEKYSKLVKCNLEGRPYLQVGNFVCYYDQEYLVNLISVKKSDPFMRRFLCEIGEIEYKEEFSTMKQGEFLPLIQNSLVVNPYTYLQILKKRIKKLLNIREDRSLKTRLTCTRYSRSHSRVDFSKLNSWYRCESLIKQAEADGLVNITPWILKFSEDPHNLKKRFGKSLWRRLCKKSFSYNQKLIEYSRRPIDQSKVERVDLLNFLIQFPSRLHIYTSDKRIREYLVGVCTTRRKLKTLGKLSSRDFVNIWSDARDTLKMIEHFQTHSPHLKIPNFNPKWSESKMQEIHDYLATLKIEASKKVYPWLKDLGLEYLTYSDSGYIFRLLSSPYELKIEGEVMSHCVGHYDDRVAKGKYLVISMENQSENIRATIGCNIVTPLKVADSRPYTSLPIMEDGDVTRASLELDQVKGKYNQIIPDEHYPFINHFTRLLTEELNPRGQTRIYDQLMCEYKLKNHY